MVEAREKHQDPNDEDGDGAVGSLQHRERCERKKKTYIGEPFLFQPCLTEQITTIIHPYG